MSPLFVKRTLLHYLLETLCVCVCVRGGGGGGREREQDSHVKCVCVFYSMTATCVTFRQFMCLLPFEVISNRTG